MVKKAIEFIAQNDLIQKKDIIIVGVSGGADSICLLLTLLELKKKYETQLIVAHFNHGLRKKEVQKEQRIVEELAKKHALPFYTKKLTISKKEKPTEALLREKRHRFFQEVCKEAGGQKIATGHTKNDQAETVLMRLLRGTGTTGLSGMLPKNNLLIRPLLNVSREEVEQYLKMHKQRFATDSSNKDERFMRNKIRHKLLPYLKKNFNPKIIDTLATVGKNTTGDRQWIETQSKKYIETIVTQTGGSKSSIVLDMEKFGKAPKAMQKYVLRHVATLQKKRKNETVTDAMIEELHKEIKNKQKRGRLGEKSLKL